MLRSAVNADDFVMLKKYLLTTTSKVTDWKAGDLDGNGVLNADEKSDCASCAPDLISDSLATTPHLFFMPRKSRSPKTAARVMVR